MILLYGASCYLCLSDQIQRSNDGKQKMKNAQATINHIIILYLWITVSGWCSAVLDAVGWFGFNSINLSWIILNSILWL